jgi:hypothetical protein
MPGVALDRLFMLHWVYNVLLKKYQDKLLLIESKLVKISGFDKRSLPNVRIDTN